MEKKEKIPKKKDEKDSDKKEKEVVVKELESKEKGSVSSEDNLEEDSVGDNFVNSRLAQILANPWKEVSLSMRNLPNGLSLEENFIDNRPQETEPPKPSLQYIPKQEEDISKDYRADLHVANPNDPFMSEQERILVEQKRLYSNPQNLRPDIRKIDTPELPGIKPEDTVKGDYLTKKKFFV